jgi:hypothetical protein
MSLHNATAAEVGAAFGVHDRTVRDIWVKEGCPHEIRKVKRGNGKAYWFSLAEVAKWYAQREIKRAIGEQSDIDAEEAKRRKLAAEAELAEIEVKKARGTLANMKIIAEEVGGDYGRVRARFVQFPSLAPKLVFLGDIQKGHQVLLDAVNDVLRELQGPAEDSVGADEGSAEELQADPEVDDQPVGGQVRKAARRVGGGARKMEHGAG